MVMEMPEHCTVNYSGCYNIQWMLTNHNCPQCGNRTVWEDTEYNCLCVACEISFNLRIYGLRERDKYTVRTIVEHKT